MSIVTGARWGFSVIGAVALEQGIEKLQDIIGSYFKGKQLRLSPKDLEYLNSHKYEFPSTYSRYGLLFEVVWMDNDKGRHEYFIRPCGFGQTPAHALVNRDVLGDDVAANGNATGYIADRERRFLEMAASAGRAVDRQAIWLEYDPISRNWRTEPVSWSAVERAADIQRRSLESLRLLAANSAGLESLRTYGVAWQAMLGQFQSELRQRGAFNSIDELVRQNDDSARSIEKALVDARNLEASSAFLDGLSFFGAVLNLGAAFSEKASADAEKLDAAAEYRHSEVRRHGDLIYKREITIKEKWENSLGRETKLPKFDLEKITEPLRERRKRKG